MQAQISAIEGNADQVVAHMQTALDQDILEHTFLENDPFFAEFRDEPRLVAIADEMRERALAAGAHSAQISTVHAQGGEGGGHTGDVGSVVLWPQIVDAIGDLPMLAAGGIGLAALLLTPVLSHRPKPTLAATIIVAITPLLDLKAIRRAWQIARVS